MPYLDGFYIEVHYEDSEIQNSSIRRVLEERGKTVYAIALRAGAIIADNEEIRLLGDVKTFKAE